MAGNTEELAQLAQRIKERNRVGREITAIIGRPAEIGHIGEYIASRIFNIDLEESASHKSIDGRFRDGPLKGQTVNVKWYARREALLDIAPDPQPDYYLVLAGPKGTAASSRGRSRPWSIERVFLFRGESLVPELRKAGVKLGIATSVRNELWQLAEIFPAYRTDLLPLSKEQRATLLLFGPQFVAPAPQTASRAHNGLTDSDH